MYDDYIEMLSNRLRLEHSVVFSTNKKTNYGYIKVLYYIFTQLVLAYDGVIYMDEYTTNEFCEWVKDIVDKFNEVNI